MARGDPVGSSTTMGGLSIARFDQATAISVCDIASVGEDCVTSHCWFPGAAGQEHIHRIHRQCDRADTSWAAYQQPYIRTIQSVHYSGIDLPGHLLSDVTRQSLSG